MDETYIKWVFLLLFFVIMIKIKEITGWVDYYIYKLIVI